MKMTPFPFFWPPKPVRVWRETPTFDRLMERFTNGEFSCEPKIDGWRVLIYANDGKVQAMSRHKKAIILSSEVTQKLLTLPQDTILDGELLGPRGGENQFVAFDVVKCEGVFTMNQPYVERREILEGLSVDFVLTLTGKLSDLYDLSLKDGNEGLVLKKVNSPWKAMSGEGQEFDAWIKIKRRPKLDESGKVQQ